MAVQRLHAQVKPPVYNITEIEQANMDGQVKRTDTPDAAELPGHGVRV